VPGSAPFAAWGSSAVGAESEAAEGLSARCDT